MVVSAQEELDCVLASEGFANSPRLVRLLRYIVEKSVEGNREALKEYSIGLDVFDRDPSFDPKVDSIVRSTARQLRLKLAQYYQTDGRDRPLWIALPKGSYVAEFQERTVTGSPRASEARPTLRPRYLAITLLALGMVAAVSLALNRPRSTVHPRTVAVLPFRDLSPHQDLGYIAEGLRDGLTSALVRAKGLELTARVSSQGIANGADPTRAAKAASSETLILGSVAPSGEEFQATVHLLDGKTGKYLWSETYQGRASDLAEMEHRAAAGAAAALGASAEIPAPPLPHNAEALELFLRAAALARTRQAAAMHEAARLYERVLSLEPDFALGYASAASNYLVAVANGAMRWREGGPRGIELARRAVALDASLAEAHDALALGLESQWQWREAGAEFARAIELDPRSPLTYFRKAVDEASRGRFADAERSVETARLLDPSWSAPDGLLAEIYYYTRRWSDALKLAQRLRDTWHDADMADNISWRVYIAQGNLRLARPFLAAHTDALSVAWLRFVDGDAGRGWRELLAASRSESVPACWIAGFAAGGLHDPQLALNWLEHSFRDREPDLTSLAIDPVFDAIRSTPRADALLHEMNL
jgi:serine/threonine-protein kinase